MYDIIIISFYTTIFSTFQHALYVIRKIALTQNMHAMHDAGKGIFVKTKSLDTPTNQQHLKLVSLKKFGLAKN